MLGSSGWRTPCQGTPHRGYPIRRGPSFELNREVIRRSTPKYKGTLDTCPLYYCAVRGWPIKQTHSHYRSRRSKPGNQPEVNQTSEEPSNEATTQRSHTVVPRGGSAYRARRPTQVIHLTH